MGAAWEIEGPQDMPLKAAGSRTLGARLSDRRLNRELQSNGKGTPGGMGFLCPAGRGPLKRRERGANVTPQHKADL